jgi:transposase, IS5 family
MAQVGLFDFEERYQQLQAQGDPLARLNTAIPWEKFRPTLEKAREKERKDHSGRKPFDVMLMFKILILQALYNLSDENTEYQIRDRISFMHFLGLKLHSRVPDEKTIWLFKDTLAQLGLVRPLFDRFNRFLDQQGLHAKGGSIVDATIVEVPRQRNTREENQQIKAGGTPESFTENPAKAAQKDTDARWITKNGVRYYGYKNHVNTDRKHKFIRKFAVTDAAVHDSQPVGELMDGDNTNGDFFGDSAYRSAEIHAQLEEGNYRDRTQRKGYRGHPLSQRSQAANSLKSRVRARVEHIFARQRQFGGKLLRGIGLVRMKAKIGLRNLLYNMDRYTRQYA